MNVHERVTQNNPKVARTYTGIWWIDRQTECHVSLAVGEQDSAVQNEVQIQTTREQRHRLHHLYVW